MLPTTVQLLTRIVTEGDAVRASERPRGGDAIQTMRDLDREVDAVLRRPSEERRPVVDAATSMLITCMLHYEQLGPFGDRELTTKWRTLVVSALPFVRTDLARAVELSRPSTSDHDFQKR